MAEKLKTRTASTDQRRAIIAALREWDSNYDFRSTPSGINFYATVLSHPRQEQYPLAITSGFKTRLDLNLVFSESGQWLYYPDAFGSSAEVSFSFIGARQITYIVETTFKKTTT